MNLSTGPRPRSHLATGAILLGVAIVVLLMLWPRHGRSPTTGQASGDGEPGALTLAGSGRRPSSADPVTGSGGTPAGSSSPAQAGRHDMWSPSDRSSPGESARTRSDPGDSASGLSQAVRGAIRVTFLDAETGSPLESQPVRLSFRGPGRSLTRRARTSRQGRLSLGGLPAGEYTLRTDVATYQTDLRRVRVVATAGEVAPAVVIALERGFSLEGSVVDARGSPLAGARIRWVPRGALNPGAVHGKSGPTGRFRLSGLSPGGGLLEVALEGYRSPVPREVIVPGAAGSLQFVLERDVPALARVLRTDGTPVQGARLRWRIPGVLPGRSWSSAPPVETDSAGLARLEGLPATPEATLGIEVTHPDHAPLRTALMVRDLDRRSASRPFELELPPGGDVAGRVMDVQGRPAGNVRLVLDGPERRQLVTVTDGSFRFPHLPAGLYSLSADGGERGHARVADLGDPTQDELTAITVALEWGSGRIAGRILGANGGAVARVPVQAFLEGHHFLVHSGADGRFALESIPEGEYDIRAGSRELGEKTLRAIPTGTLDLTIRLGDHGTITGIVDLPGPPRPYSIRLVPGGVDEVTTPGADAELVYRFTAGNLHFRCRRVPAGIWDVLLEQGGEILTRAGSLEVTAGGETGPVELSVP